MKNYSGDNINSKTSQWNFSGKTAKNFDKHISKSVPLYEWSHDVALKTSDFFLTQNSHAYDLGCSTGTFLNKICKRNNNSKKIKFTGIDEIKDMCKIAKKNNKKNRNVKILNKNINSVKFEKKVPLSPHFIQYNLFIHLKDRHYLIKFLNLLIGVAHLFILKKLELQTQDSKISYLKFIKIISLTKAIVLKK